jgi:putative tricarboxylic transport membrane protein
VLGVILGPRVEKELRTSLQLSDGQISGLFSEPVAVAVYVIVGIVLLWPLVQRYLRPRPGTSTGPGDDVDTASTSDLDRDRVSS